MNDLDRRLLRFVCDGDIRSAQTQARIMLEKPGTKRDEQFRQNMLEKLETKKIRLTELPFPVKSLLTAEDVSEFREGRFLVRANEAAAATEVIRLYAVADKLSQLKISHPCAIMLHGQSGCGKTMLARYIAYKLKMPFVYVRFSNLVSSTLGSTQANVAKIFDFARQTPCVLCMDEIDAVGVERGAEHDVSEMNRVVIALMQELDNVPNNVIVVGTTNRYDRLDPALVRRFPYQHEIIPLTHEEACDVARMFFADTDVDMGGWFDGWIGTALEDKERIPAAVVTKACVNKLIEILLQQEEQGKEDSNE